MHPEEEKRLLAKWAVFHCPWDKTKKTNMPVSIVSPLFDTSTEVEKYLEEHFPKRKQYEYGVFKTDGQNGFH